MTNEAFNRLQAAIKEERSLVDLKYYFDGANNTNRDHQAAVKETDEALVALINPMPTMLWDPETVSLRPAEIPPATIYFIKRADGLSLSDLGAKIESNGYAGSLLSFSKEPDGVTITVGPSRRAKRFTVDPAAEINILPREVK